MAVARDKTRIYITITRTELERLERIVAAKRKDGYKASVAGVAAQLLRESLPVEYKSNGQQL
jgi:hypothetical protein